MDFPLTIIEPGIGQWRSADIDADEIPTDLRFHDDAKFSALDAIFDARVTSVDKALDMAFLDLGEGLSGALNFRRARLLVKGKATGIADCVQEGQLIRVQVIAEPSALDAKALPVTARPRMAGRYVVAEAGAPRLNLSKDLTARKTKELKELIAPTVADAALIVRARAQEAPAEAVAAEAKRLHDILAQPQRTPKELGRVHSWTPAERALLSAPDTDTPILVEGGSAFADTKAQAKAWPDLHKRLAPYTGENAFDTLGVEEAIEEALADKIMLPSGGWLSITPTPALTAVDVNMGGALKHMNASEAKLVVNMEATLALGHHMRFQDIGGIIVVDYINMSGKGSTRDLMQLIERTCREDTVPVQHTGISAFGLVEFTRKRNGLSLRDRMLATPAPIERPDATAACLLRRAMRLGNTAQPGKLVLSAQKQTIDWLKNHPETLTALAEATKRTVELEAASAVDIKITAG